MSRFQRVIHNCAESCPLRITLIAVLIGLTPLSASATETDVWAERRVGMIQAIRSTVAYTGEETGVTAIDKSVMDALSRVPRHEFVPTEIRELAYENRPLPVGHGQTISQPYIVALMTHLLALDERAVVLEVGTGSGYQAAVLAELVNKVFTIEIVTPLAKTAGERLQELGYDNVTVINGDGYYGWQEHAPFDAIIVTAAGNHVAPPLVDQLRPGARLVIPVGAPYTVQQLLVVTKQEDGTATVRQVLPVRFVPLTGGH